MSQHALPCALLLLLRAASSCARRRNSHRRLPVGCTTTRRQLAQPMVALAVLADHHRSKGNCSSGWKRERTRARCMPVVVLTIVTTPHRPICGSWAARPLGSLPHQGGRTRQQMARDGSGAASTAAVVSAAGVAAAGVVAALTHARAHGVRLRHNAGRPLPCPFIGKHICVDGLTRAGLNLLRPRRGSCW